MKNYRPLLLPNLGISLPSLRVHQFRLNHHMPEPVWTTHAHEDHGQILIYLSGRGKQQMGERAYDCRPGTVVYVPPGQVHAFSRQMQRAPMVAVVDLHLEITRATPHPAALMPHADLVKVKSAVSRLFGIQTGQREAALIVASLIIEILDRALLASGWLKPFNRYGDSKPNALTKFTERLLDRMSGTEITLEEIAKRAGYQVEALNRKLKAECGLTLGQLRARQRLLRAQTLIRQGWPMQTVAEKVGMPDNNYFSRWFRQHTGMTPSQFKKSPQQPARI